MQRRDFLKVIGFGLTGLLMPEWALVSERKKRMLGEILKRIAQGKPVSKAELDKLENLGNQLELQSQFTTSIQDGTGTVKANEVMLNQLQMGSRKINDIIIDMRNLQGGAGAMPIADNTTTLFTEWELLPIGSNGENPGGFIIDNGTIYVPASGRYFIEAYGEFDANSTGHRELFISSGSTGSTHYDAKELRDRRSALASVRTSMHVGGEYNVAAGGYFRLYFYQNSGGSLNVDFVYISIRQI